MAIQAKVHPENEISCHLVLGHDERAYRTLFAERKEIHDELGEALKRKSPENSDTTRNRAYTDKPWDIRDESRWDEYIDWLVRWGGKFDSVFRKRLASL